MKTSDLIGPALDWAVAKCEELKIRVHDLREHGGVVQIFSVHKKSDYWYAPSINWNEGGPIIEREKIELIPLWLGDNFEGYAASHRLSIKYDEAGEFIQGSNCKQYGPTPLIAAMRAFVASKLGDDVEIPEELKC